MRARVHARSSAWQGCCVILVFWPRQQTDHINTGKIRLFMDAPGSGVAASPSADQRATSERISLRAAAVSWWLAPLPACPRQHTCMHAPGNKQMHVHIISNTKSAPKSIEECGRDDQVRAAPYLRASSTLAANTSDTKNAVLLELVHARACAETS